MHALGVRPCGHRTALPSRPTATRHRTPRSARGARFAAVRYPLSATVQPGNSPSSRSPTRSWGPIAQCPAPPSSARSRRSARPHSRLPGRYRRRPGRRPPRASAARRGRRSSSGAAASASRPSRPPIAPAPGAAWPAAAPVSGARPVAHHCRRRPRRVRDPPRPARHPAWRPTRRARPRAAPPPLGAGAWLIALCRDVFARSFVPSTVTSPSFTSPAPRASRTVARNTQAKSSRCRTRKRLIVRESAPARPPPGTGRRGRRTAARSPGR